jgi:hypothetical protein
VDSGFQKVMPKLNAFIEDRNHTTDFVLVAGDNYYPEKNKTKDKEKNKTKDKEKDNKQKIIHADALKSGFDSLPTNVDVHIILGNHDVETGEQMFVPSEKGQDAGLDQAKSCLIAELERSHVNNKQTLNVYKTFMWTEDTAIVMFDTTIYDLLEPDANTESVECYRPFFNGIVGNKIADNEISDNEISAKQIVDEQEEHILQFLRENGSEIKHVILVGHYPIVSVKGKIDESTGKTKNKTECCLFSDFLKKIHGVFTQQIPEQIPEYHYLCADVHMYQRGTVNLDFPGNSHSKSVKDTIRPMTIEQYVVGTGGAALDDLPDTSDPLIKCKNNTTNIPITYSISEAKKENGFLHCIITNDVPVFEFIV